MASSSGNSLPAPEAIQVLVSSLADESPMVKQASMASLKALAPLSIFKRESSIPGQLKLPRGIISKLQIQPCSYRNYEDRNDALEFTPNRLQVTETSEVCTSHGIDGQIERDNSSSSGRARSKRERKPKVHFDEVSYPLYTSRKHRRFKIMRSLGLAAPVGSPFNSS